jgi:hypothetical protein
VPIVDPLLAPWQHLWMALFTMMLDYAGGTYISQVEAENEQEAFRTWLAKLRPEQIVDAVSDEVADAFRETEPNFVPLEGLDGAWCGSTSARGGLALLNFVRTSATG